MYEEPESKTLMIPISEILIDQEFNCRRKITPLDVNALATDIRERGLLAPVIVAPMEPDAEGHKFKLLAGFRRTFAHKVLERTHIEAKISQEQDEIKQRSINLRENLVRKDLTVLEEAYALKPFFDRGLSDDRITDELGLTRGYLQIRRYILALPEDIQKEIEDGNISQPEVRELYTFLIREGEDKMRSAAYEMKDNRQRGIKRKVKSKKKEASQKRTRKRPEMFALQNHLRKMNFKGLPLLILGWVAGELSDDELNEDLEAICERQGSEFIRWEGE